MVLDPDGFAITPGQETYNPAVAFGGDRYLVSWQDYRNDWHSVEDTDIYSARVASDGEVLDPDGFLTSRGLTTQFDVAVATDGEDYLVAWTDDRPTAGEYDIYAARVSGSGEILDGGGFPVATVWGDQFQPGQSRGTAPSTSSSGGTSGTGGTTTSTGHGSRPTAQCSTQNRSKLRRARGTRVRASRWRVAASGSWPPGRTARTRSEPRGSMRTGSALDPDGFVVSVAEASVADSPKVAWGDTAYLVVWREAQGEAIAGARVTDGGVVLDPPGIEIATGPNLRQAPVVAWSGTSHLVAWSDFRDGVPNSNVYGARVTDDGVVADPDGLLISARRGHQVPAIAWDGANFLLAWRDARDDSRVPGHRQNTRLGLGRCPRPERFSDLDQSTPRAVSRRRRRRRRNRGRRLSGARRRRKVAAAGGDPPRHSR